MPADRNPHNDDMDEIEGVRSLLHQQRALRKVAGSLRDVDTPGWETPNAASEWVAKGRVADDERLDDCPHRDQSSRADGQS
jgi:hypothetical protein